MKDIPEIVEELYYGAVTIPDQKEWPDYMCGNPLVAHDLYSFYSGLRMGFYLSKALPESVFSPDAE